ncbi:MAG: DUF885 domain-containing protein, partial [Burkholderiales bacterium]
MQTPSAAYRGRWPSVCQSVAAKPTAPKVAVATPAPANSAAKLLDQIAWRLLALYPEQATALGIDKGDHAALRHSLEEKSPEGVARLAALIESDLGAVRRFPKDTLDPSTRTSLAVVERAYASALEGFALPYGEVAVGGWRNAPYVVIQNVGAYLDIPRFLDAGHPLQTAADAEAYLDRLGQMAQQLEGERERIRIAQAAGLIPPDFLIDRTIAQLGQTIRDTAGGGPLVESLTKRTAALAGNWEKRAGRIVTSAVLPALQRQLQTMQDLRGAARSEPGMRERPHGEAWYGWALSAATTTRHSPAEVHRQGLEELAALHARMDPILHSLGYTQGSVGTRMAALSRDPRFQFPQGDPGRAEIMALIRQRINWIVAQMPRAFRTLGSGNVDVRRLPPAEEPGAPAAYGGSGSIDGSVPGKMWINLGSTDLHRKYDLPTLVHHETVPGHVWQGEYANRLPLIRSILQFNPYSEGWALYAEQLADELGAYDDDPVGRLGYLQSLAFRACRMVVDTGLHAMGWPRERAIAFFMHENGNSRDEVASEVDRYCSWPGQACGYKMGHSEIVRQRARAQQALGEHYDLRDFNQAVVDGGNVPLDVLGDNVERYIN